jgi:hypothetical protein
VAGIFNNAIFNNAIFNVGEVTPVADTPQQGGGGGYPNDHPLPQYYSRRVLNERISLPQDEQSNKVAISVLDDARDLEARLAKDDRGFADMLEQTDHMLKQVAVFVDSQQIYNVVRTIQAKVKARQDAEIAVRMKVAQDKNDDDEFAELMEIL